MLVEYGTWTYIAAMVYSILVSIAPLKSVPLLSSLLETQGHRLVTVLINILALAQVIPEEVERLVAENIKLVLVQVVTRGKMVVALSNVMTIVDRIMDIVPMVLLSQMVQTDVETLAISVVCLMKT